MNNKMSSVWYSEWSHPTLGGAVFGQNISHAKIDCTDFINCSAGRGGAVCFQVQFFYHYHASKCLQTYILQCIQRMA